MNEKLEKLLITRYRKLNKELEQVNLLRFAIRSEMKAIFEVLPKPDFKECPMKVCDGQPKGYCDLCALDFTSPPPNS